MVTETRRRKRLDRSIKVRSESLYALSSWSEMAYLLDTVTGARKAVEVAREMAERGEKLRGVRLVHEVKEKELGES